METRIRDVRAERGWTVRRLAEESGVDKNTISEAERGKRNPNPITMHKLARALGVEVRELLPLGPAPLPEQHLTSSPEVRKWLRDQGAFFALMTREEFSELVLDAGTLEGVEELVGEVGAEDQAVERALMREFRDGGDLFPEAPAGPDEWTQTLTRTRAVTRLQRALADDYHGRRLALVNYSRKLYSSGRTADFLAHPKQAETIRQQMLEEAFAEEGAA